MTVQLLSEELSREITTKSSRGELTLADKRAMLDLMSNILTATPAPDWLNAYIVEKR